MKTQTKSVPAETVAMPQERKPATRFLNVDLDVGAHHGIEELVGHFGPAVMVLYQTGQFVSLELNKDYGSLEEKIRKMIDIVQSLPPEGKSIWKQCNYRRFNIGIEGGKEPHAAIFTMSGETISLLAAVQGEIALTIYAPKAG